MHSENSFTQVLYGKIERSIGEILFWGLSVIFALAVLTIPYSIIMTFAASGWWVLVTMLAISIVWVFVS